VTALRGREAEPELSAAKEGRGWEPAAVIPSGEAARDLSKFTIDD